MVSRGMKTFVAILLYFIGAIFKKDPQFLSIYFHDVNPTIFERVVKWCIGRGYGFISLKDLVQVLNGRKQISGKFVFISFDDGVKGNLELIPLFEKYMIPVTIFCSVQPVVEGGGFWWDYVLKKTGSNRIVESMKNLPEEQFLKEINKIKQEVYIDRSAVTIEQLIEMDKNKWIDIQSHTMTHPILTNLSYDSLKWELEASKIFLERKLNKKIFAFSYPNGSFSSREVEETKKFYTCAVSTEESYPKPGCNMFLIPRIVQDDEFWPNLARIKGTWQIIRSFKKIIRVSL